MRNSDSLSTSLLCMALDMWEADFIPYEHLEAWAEAFAESAYNRFENFSHNDCVALEIDIINNIKVDS